MKKKIFCLLLAAIIFLPIEAYAATDGSREFSYTFKGKRKKIKVNLDSSVYNYIYNIPRVACPTCSSITERDRPIITEPIQKANLAPLVEAIKSKAKKRDDRARIAVSLIQSIPYDWDKYDDIEAGKSVHLRYPYEVLYDNSQICSENSYLIAFLLSEFGFASGVFKFPSASHDVAAIKCPMKYSFKNTGYCFIESTYRRIITYNTVENKNTDDYILEDLDPDGDTFNPAKDYKDAQSLRKINKKKKLKKKDRKKLNKLIKKYGL